MRGRWTAGLVVALAAFAFAFAAPAFGAGYTVKTLHWDVTVGPANDQHCDVIGDLYKPDAASSSNPAPAILTTNGSGGSKDDQADVGKFLAGRGYVVLPHAGLRCRRTRCKVNLDHPHD